MPSLLPHFPAGPGRRLSLILPIPKCLRSHSAFTLLSLVLLALAPFSGCGDPSPLTLHTSVQTLPSEDLVGPCNYQLYLQNPGQKQAGVLVIFDRADSGELYNDSSVRHMAGSLGFSLVFAYECDALSFNDLQPDASKGPARALFTALDQFAEASGHSELRQSPVVLNGFSAAGILSLTMANFAPSRVLGVLAYAPGSSYLDLLDVTPSAGALAIPTLILANAQDPTAGTTRGMSYFLKGRAHNAPWGFGVQNQSAHCCNLTIRPMLVSWVPGVVSSSLASPQTVEFVCTPNGVIDMYNETNCRITYASVGSQPNPGVQTAWMPDIPSAQAWLAWVTNTGVNQ